MDAHAGFTAQQKTMLATWLTEIMLDRMNKLQGKPQELAQVPGHAVHLLDDMIVPTGIAPNAVSLRCQVHHEHILRERRLIIYLAAIDRTQFVSGLPQTPAALFDTRHRWRRSLSISFAISRVASTKILQ